MSPEVHPALAHWLRADATAEEVLTRIAEQRGVMACALLDSWSGTVALSWPAPWHRNVDIAAACLVRGARTERGLTREISIELTLEHHWILRLPDPRLLLYVIIDRPAADLGALRNQTRALLGLEP